MKFTTTESFLTNCAFFCTKKEALIDYMHFKRSEYTPNHIQGYRDEESIAHFRQVSMSCGGNTSRFPFSFAVTVDRVGHSRPRKQFRRCTARFHKRVSPDILTSLTKHPLTPPTTLTLTITHRNPVFPYIRIVALTYNKKNEAKKSHESPKYNPHKIKWSHIAIIKALYRTNVISTINVRRVYVFRPYPANIKANIP